VSDPCRVELQLGKVFAALGTPTEEQWKGMRTLPDFVEFMHTPAPDKRLLFTNIPDDALHLLNRLLCFDPNQRITAEEALAHRYFKTSPAPTPHQNLPRISKKQEDVPCSTAVNHPARSLEHPFIVFSTIDEIDRDRLAVG